MLSLNSNWGHRPSIVECVRQKMGEPCTILPCPVLFCPLLSCPVLSCPAISCLTLPCPAMTCHILSSPVLPLCHCVCVYVYCTVYMVSICTLFIRVHRNCSYLFTNHTLLARVGDDFQELKINMAVIIYAKRLISSATVLCVPGMGYDTYRVFETLLAG